jgi:hypothetical protein
MRTLGRAVIWLSVIYLFIAGACTKINYDCERSPGLIHVCSSALWPFQGFTDTAAAAPSLQANLPEATPRPTVGPVGVFNPAPPHMVPPVSTRTPN